VWSLNFFTEWQRKRKREKLEKWRLEVVHRLIFDVLPAATPYQYDTALSFLQSSSFPINLADPVRITLFLPEYPLAIDLLAADDRPDFELAQRYLSQKEWTHRQERLSRKIHDLEEYRCPYLVIRDNEPVDTHSLKERVRSVSGLRVDPRARTLVR
jgi:hypothetical protein